MKSSRPVSSHREKLSSSHALSRGQTAIDRLRSSALAAFLAVGVTSCGGGSESTSTPSSSPSPTTPQPSVPVTPPSSIPSHATATVKLGMLSGSSVTFKQLDGRVIGYGGTTGADGSFSYNPRSLVSQIGQDDLVLVEVAGGVDRDSDQDGMIDSDGGKAIQGSFRTIVPRSYIESGRSFAVSPSSALATETILSTKDTVNRTILDTSAVAMETHDQNSDGQIGYDDVIALTPTNTSNNIEVASSASGFTQSIYTGDDLARREAIEWNLERQNTIRPSIGIDFRDTTNHRPILSLRTTTPNSAIIYTLDGSLPTLESPSTRRILDQLDVGMQDAQLTYREVYSVDGQQVLGGAESFDLLAGFFMLGQATSRAQSRAVLDQNITETHKGISYFISAKTLFPQDGTGYPAAIDCGSTTYPDYGCDRAPYIAYTQEQKDRFVSLIRADIRSDIESGYLQDPTDPVKPVDPEIPPPTHLPSEQVVYRDRTEYLGTWYRLTHTYNLDGKSDFPVKITGSYALPNAGRQDNIETLVYAASDLSSASETIIAEIKSLIKKAYDAIPRPTYPQNTEFRESGAHRGSSYTLITVMNINGDMDYPARVYAEYSLPDGTKKTTTRFVVNDEREKSQVQADVIASAKSSIDVALDDRRTMGEVELNQGITYDRGGSYKVETHYSHLPGKDYPGYVVIDFTLPNGISDRWTREVENEAFRDAAILQGVEWVQDQITLAIPTEPVKPTPIYPQNHRVEHTPRTEYLGAWYSLTQYYNLDGESDYPVKIIGSYSLPNGSRQENKEGWAHTLEEITTKTKQILDDIIRAIKEAFDALPKPTYPQNTELTDRGSYRGYDYTLVTVMNLTGDSDYPAKVYVDYMLPSGQIDRTSAVHANDAQELSNIKAERLQNIQSKIDKALDDRYAPGYTETIQGLTYENGGSYIITFEYAYNAGVDYPGYILIDYTLPDGTSDRWTYQAENSQEKNTMIEQGRIWVRDQIARSYPPAPNHAPNQIVRQFTRVYGSGEYSLYVKYNRVGNGQDYPAFVFGEYLKYNLPGQIFNPPPTQREVYSAWEEEQAIRDIESYIQGRLSIGQRTSAQVRASSRLSIADVLRGLSPISSAYAESSEPQQCLPQVKKEPFKVPNFQNSLFSSKLPQVTPACEAGHEYRELFVTDSVPTTSPVTQKTELLRHATRDATLPPPSIRLDASIRESLNELELLTGQGSTADGFYSGGMSQAEIARRKAEATEKLYYSIGEYLGFTKEMARGMGVAFTEQVTASMGLAIDLVDGSAKDEFLKRIQTIRAQLATYTHGGQINFSLMADDFARTLGPIGQELKNALVHLPGLLMSMSLAQRGYWTGYFAANIALDVLNPLKKANLLKGGALAGTWIRYLRGFAEASSVGTKHGQLAFRLIVGPDSGRTIRYLGQFGERLSAEEANTVITTIKKGKLKIFNPHGIEYGFSEGDVKKHTRGDGGFVNDKSYFTYPNGSDMSLDDVYNLQVEAMNKVTKEDWISGPLASGKVKEVSLGRTVGFDTKKGTMTTTLCVVKNTQGLIHMFPCVEGSDN